MIKIHANKINAIKRDITSGFSIQSIAEARDVSETTIEEIMKGNVKGVGRTRYSQRSLDKLRESAIEQLRNARKTVHPSLRKEKEAVVFANYGDILEGRG